MPTVPMISPAAAITDARRNARALPAYPGTLPTSLAEAYAVQAEAISLWGAPVAGWKVGRITGEAESLLGKNRFIGPIFADTVIQDNGQSISPFPVITRGSAAFEAEIVATLGTDIQPVRDDWTAEDVRALLSALHIGIEVAGSPVPDINALGPLASVAAFGNNLGLIVGCPIADWRETNIHAIFCSVTIDGTLAGQALTGVLPGGPMGAIAFALNEAAHLGITLAAGTWLSTGAITGMHSVTAASTCRADFGSMGSVSVLTEGARAS